MWVRVCGIEPFNYMHWPLTKLCRKICGRILANIKRSLLLFPISIHLDENLKVLADFKLPLYCSAHVFVSKSLQLTGAVLILLVSDSRIKATTRPKIPFSALRSLDHSVWWNRFWQTEKPQQITALLHICSISYHLSLMIISFPERDWQSHALCCTFLTK